MRLQKITVKLSLLTATAFFLSNPQAYATKSTTTKIIMIRHGEKPNKNADTKLLDCQGLNRALKLPQVLIQKFGTPDFIFAPNHDVTLEVPTNGTTSASADSSFRPFLTIVPLAIQLNMPINLSFNYTDEKSMPKEFLKDQYAGKTIIISWEHKKLVKIAQGIYIQGNNNNPNDIPAWDDSDFDSIDIINITRDPNSGYTFTTFAQDKEGLNAQLNANCPS